jgi:hypothetical protein
MRIDRLGVALRARSSWEAVDLGFALARHYVGAWLLPWCLMTGLLMAVLLGLGHWLGVVGWVPLALWWLKPALDRVPLFVLSRAVFGHRPTRAETWRAALSWGWGPTLPRLLWLRFDPFRALSMPADLLEGLPRAERGPRRERLRRVGAGQAVSLWLLLPWFEMVLVASAWALVGLMIPMEWWAARGDGWLALLFSSSPETGWVELINVALMCLAILAIEPFFVAAGVGLYLSRRVHLEAWDLELDFKRMAARAGSIGAAVPKPISGPKRGSALSALAAVLLSGAMALGVVVVPGAASAKIAAVEPAAGIEAKAGAEAKAGKTPPRLGASALPAGFNAEGPSTQARLEQALQDASRDPSMGRTEDATSWRLRPDLAPNWSTSEQAEVAFNWKEALGRWLGAVVGMGLEGLLWLAAAIALIWVLWRFRDWLPWRRDSTVRTQAPPALNHRQLSPEDVAATPEWLRRARAAWQRGDTREAMACLYRAGLGEVSARRPRPLAPGTTEGELLRAARAIGHAPAREHVVRLVSAWRAVAYAGHRPQEEDFQALVAAWPQAFGEERA